MFHAAAMPAQPAKGELPPPIAMPFHKKDNPLDILLVEDNVSDEILTRKAIDSTLIKCETHSLQKGDEVLPYLWRRRQGGTLKMPDAILLDLGLPGIDGFEVLAQLNRAPASIRAVPIVVLTGYKDFQYACGIYDLCFLAYLSKPCDPQVVRRMLNTLHYNNNNL
jgi:CheY-like chemotaxis protein